MANDAVDIDANEEEPKNRRPTFIVSSYDDGENLGMSDVEPVHISYADDPVDAVREALKIPDDDAENWIVEDASDNDLNNSRVYVVRPAPADYVYCDDLDPTDPELIDKLRQETPVGYYKLEYWGPDEEEGNDNENEE